MTLTTAPDLVDVLTPQVEQLFERHLAATKSWMPHEMIPWERAVESDPRGAWDPERAPLSAGVRSALVVNLLTEDNLPYYFETINRMFANDVWREWARRWTAEEMRHAIVIRDYITVTHLVDLEALEHARMHQVSGGQVPQPESRGRRARVRRAAGAGDAHLAPQHGQPARRRSRLQGDGARRGRREPALPLLPRPCVGRARDRPVRTRCSRSSGRCARSRCRAAGIPDFTAHASAIAAAGHLRPRAAPRPGARAGRAAPLGHRDPRGPRARKPSSPANGPCTTSRRIGRIGRRLADRRAAAAAASR